MKKDTKGVYTFIFFASIEGNLIEIELILTVPEEAEKIFFIIICSEILTKKEKNKNVKSKRNKTINFFLLFFPILKSRKTEISIFSYWNCACHGPYQLLPRPRKEFCQWKSG